MPLPVLEGQVSGRHLHAGIQLQLKLLLLLTARNRHCDQPELVHSELQFAESFGLSIPDPAPLVAHRPADRNRFLGQ